MANGKLQSRWYAMEPIDSIIILLMASTMTLFILWLEGAVLHHPSEIQLPDFITKTYSHIWGYLTGGGGGAALLAILRNKGTSRPNYLLWSFASSILLIALAFSIALAQGAVTPPQPSMAALKFRVDFPNHEKPSLDFQQSLPQWLENEIGMVDPNQHYPFSHYSENVFWPGSGNRPIIATAARLVRQSASVDDAPGDMKFCITRNPAPPPDHTPFEIHMRCVEGGQCVLDQGDYNWAVSADCSNKSSQGHSFFSLTTEVHAQTREEHVKKPGWSVPSLMTLRQMTDRQRAGYTEFTIKSSPIPGTQNANLLRYTIFANGLPLYIDGRPPEDMYARFDASAGLDFSFGLENLSFSGADQGCENIDAQLEFLSGGQLIKQVRLSRRYAALRDAATEQVASSDGMKFDWAGRYVKPKNEDRAEVFVISTSDINEASRAKASIGKAHLSYDGMEVVGVMRPPLDKPIYGVVIGLRQPTGQVKFTFDVGYANKVLAWAKNIQSAKSSAFRYVPFIYGMKPNESGLGKLASCGTRAPQS
jgi:hypothetical protein